MSERAEELEQAVAFDVVRVTGDDVRHVSQRVAAEVPFTIQVNDTEMATLLCTPSDLKELAYGFLFASGVIQAGADVRACVLDRTRWVAHVELAQTPDPTLFTRRLYTSGCGRGIMFANASELAARHPLASAAAITRDQVVALAHWLQQASPTHRETGGIHTAGLSDAGQLPRYAPDDIGRHNAVDKAIGRALMEGADLTRQTLVTSGRTSSEILHKARRAGIALIVARSAPTHQSVLRARETGIAIIGFARGGGFTIYSHPERVVFP